MFSSSCLISRSLSSISFWASTITYKKIRNAQRIILPIFITAHKRSCGKATFSQAFVILSMGGGGGVVPFHNAPQDHTHPGLYPPPRNHKSERYASHWNAFLLFVFFVLYSGEFKLSNWYLFQARTLVTQFVHISHQMVLVSHQVGYGRFQTLNLRRLRSVLQIWKEQSNVLSGELAVRNNFNHSLSLKCVNWFSAKYICPKSYVLCLVLHQILLMQLTL